MDELGPLQLQDQRPFPQPTSQLKEKESQGPLQARQLEKRAAVKRQRQRTVTAAQMRRRKRFHDETSEKTEARDAAQTLATSRRPHDSRSRSQRDNTSARLPCTELCALHAEGGLGRGSRSVSALQGEGALGRGPRSMSALHAEGGLGRGPRSMSALQGEGGLGRGPRSTSALHAEGAPGRGPRSTALAMSLAMVVGPDRLPADEESQETLKGKLRILQADNTEVNALFRELSAHLLSISSEESIIYVTFKTFEEIWKFTTYYALGLLGHCMESLLLEQTFWLTSLDKDMGIEVSVQEDTLNLMYKGILMQSGSLFGSSSTNQMFDSSTCGGDVYLERGDIAQFEPPLVDSEWTLLCLSDGARGRKLKPALQPVAPFHQWFLKSCAERMLVGSGRPTCDFPLQFARGGCLAIADYDAEGPDELSFLSGDHIIIVGVIVSCFSWFLGRMDATGVVGLVKTSLVKAANDICESADIFLENEERTFFNLKEEHIIEETIAMLKNTSQIDIGQIYKLGEPDNSVTRPLEHKKIIERILSQQRVPSSHSVVATIGTQEDLNLDTKKSELKSPCFTLPLVVEGNNNTESYITLLSFLNGSHYKPEFGVIYGPTSELLASSIFANQADENKLTAFLGSARETARKKGHYWSQSRLCYLLGKLCAWRSSFSKARIYLEEALSVPREGFTDMKLLASIYTNLAFVYLTQKNLEKYYAMAERIAALIMGIQESMASVENDSEVLKYVVMKAVLSHNKIAEARACFILAKHHWRWGESVNAVPYIERLLVLCGEHSRTWNIATSHGYLSLGKLYSELCLPHLSISSARRASLQPSASLSDCLHGVALVLENSTRLYGIREHEISIPTQVAPQLHQALSFIEGAEDGQNGDGRKQYSALSHTLAVCLSQLFKKHEMVGHAVRSVQTLLTHWPPFPSLSVSEINSALIWLGWLYIGNNQPDKALEVLESVLASMPEHCSSPQEGVVLNMRGVALGCMGDIRRAAESYQAAIDICEELEEPSNWAVAQANLGLLCLKAGAKRLAERHLLKAVELFSELDEEGHEENLISVLLVLGQHYVQQGQLEDGKGCYEWALLFAIKVKHSDCQLRATQSLCQLYRVVKPDQALCILYTEHQLRLLRSRGDRAQEGAMMETISQLYLSLHTERAYRAALDYTKGSLAIFIDLGCREKEAYSWLQAGMIYQMLGQKELVDLYIQVAQDVGLGTGDTSFILKLLEMAGDVFFNSGQDRDKAVCFYGDRALPIAVKTGDTKTRLRLCNKLAELLLRLKLYGQAVEFAQTTLDLSIALGEED
ncbi:SH3 domain and tetratricopeptide repeat-containing protein 1 [Lampris incognitus]|uniref:SH3 domain and tetratricopeptide repeat-containing protein 1 n=1 Tax=Lampris incognitus TaxID=2546036 RepID=UPI0024B5F090|nr:SH3 domain and tetratricopeptide repeat-containing protein 1 [Lampris incognitus]